MGKTMVTGANGHKYFLQREVGRGNFAVVYRCVDKCDPNNTPYACKVIDKRILLGQDSMRANNFRTNTLREIQIMREVHHPNVLALHDLLETREHLYLFMPLFVLHRFPCLFMFLTWMMCLTSKFQNNAAWLEANSLRRSARAATSLKTVHAGFCGRLLRVLNISIPSAFAIAISRFVLSDGTLSQCVCFVLHFDVNNSRKTFCARTRKRISMW